MPSPTPSFAASAPVPAPRHRGPALSSRRPTRAAPPRMAAGPAPPEMPEEAKTAGAAPPEMPEEAKAAVKGGEDVAYWRGEWICVDCGYVYKPGRRIKFEDLPSSWKCPQCNAPKRRFAKKAGEVIAETAGTSNVPIIIFSVVGVLATVLFGIWASANL